MTTRLYGNIPENQEALIAALAERYADQDIRFDTGFVGSVPVQASGRIGRRFFYFRFRGDTASLTIGSRNRRQDGSHFRRDRTKSLRTLRRWKDDDDAYSLERFIAERNLRRNTSLYRHPSVPVRYAVINDVTGEQWAGSLEPEEAGQLFICLMDGLQPAVRHRPLFRKWQALRRGTYTPPNGHTPSVIRKPSSKKR